MNLIEAGAAKQKVGDLSSAEHCYFAALVDNPSDSAAWQALAVIQAGKGYLESAVSMTERAISLDRDRSTALTLCNLGNLLWRIEKIPEALEAFSQAKDAGLDNWMLWSNLGLLHLSAGEPKEAIEYFSKAFETMEDEKQIEELITQIGYAYLMSGDFPKGFGLVQRGWSKSVLPLHYKDIPQWDGGDLKGAKILVYHHQGAGDTIQFSRFLTALEDLGASKIVLAVPENLVRLFEVLNIADEVCQVDGPLPLPHSSFDLMTPISSLPLYLGIQLQDLENCSRYTVNTPPRPVRTREGPLKVGLVWAARQSQETGPRRSIPLKQLLPLTSIPGVQICGLQVGENSKDIKEMGAEYLIKDYSPRIRDFYDLAKIMNSAMDVIISADTAPLHLAGSIGVPTIGMLSYSAADWRWLSKERTTSPWYPGMQLVRQKKPRDWSGVVEEVGNRLKGMRDMSQ